ncbi:MAG: hypothetical protein NTZ55_05290 [Candidatus Roizmanbacteria bacterium]|nr:hypothetical protein [Candidatus Roizmanbacteria bacterium]
MSKRDIFLLVITGILGFFSTPFPGIFNLINYLCMAIFIFKIYRLYREGKIFLGKVNVAEQKTINTNTTKNKDVIKNSSIYDRVPKQYLDFYTSTTTFLVFFLLFDLFLWMITDVAITGEGYFTNAFSTNSNYNPKRAFLMIILAFLYPVINYLKPLLLAIKPTFDSINSMLFYIWPILLVLILLDFSIESYKKKATK